MTINVRLNCAQIEHLGLPSTIWWHKRAWRWSSSRTASQPRRKPTRSASLPRGIRGWNRHGGDGSFLETTKCWSFSPVMDNIICAWLLEIGVFGMPGIIYKHGFGLQDFLLCEQKNLFVLMNPVWSQKHVALHESWKGAFYAFPLTNWCPSFPPIVSDFFKVYRIYRTR